MNNCNYPKTKENLIFDDVFLEKIRSKTKRGTIRNSPVSLGFKKLSNDLHIKVYSCSETSLTFNSSNREVSLEEHGALLHQYFGFANDSAMYNFYNKYIKNQEQVFQIYFKVINNATS